MTTIDDVIRRLQELKIVHDLPGDKLVNVLCDGRLADVRAIDFSPSTGIVVVFLELQK